LPVRSLEFVNPPFPRKTLLHLVVGDHVVLLDGLLDDVNAIENSSDEAKIGCDFEAFLAHVAKRQKLLLVEMFMCAPFQGVHGHLGLDADDPGRLVVAVQPVEEHDKPREDLGLEHQV